jgi:hypothetical protein
VRQAPAVLLLTLRADFYMACAPYELLRQGLAQYQEYIGAMSAAELHRAIEWPARQGGWELEPGLAELFLRDVGAGGNGQQPEPGTLPLLSHALYETWLHRRGRTLTLAGYAEAGGVQGAIAKTAEAVYTGLSPEGQVLARRIFLRLTELGDANQATRRRVDLNELTSLADKEQDIRQVLNILAEARLVTLSAETAEVAHEALIWEWRRLQDWLNEDRESLLLHRRLTVATQEWQRLQGDQEALYRGARLAQALEWADASPQELNRAEGLTVILVTHDVEVARQTDRAVVLVDGEVVVDTPDIEQAQAALHKRSALDGEA